MNFKKIITLNLLLLLFIFVSCNKQSNLNPLVKYIGSYIRVEKSIDIYESQKTLYIRLNQNKIYKINPNKKGIFKTDFVSGYFTAKEESLYNILYIDNIAWTRFKLRNNKSNISLKPSINPSELIGKALMTPLPSKLKNGKIDPLSQLEYKDNQFMIQMKFANNNNNLAYDFYEENKAFLCITPAQALKKAQADLKKEGFGLIIKDAYRPWFVTWLMWKSINNPKKAGVSDPSEGSIFNRGNSVEVSLYSIETGKAVKMVNEYDDISYRSSPGYLGGSSEERENRTLLTSIMQNNGFIQDTKKWWHFDYKDYADYAFHNESFAELSVLLK